ncbi:MAG TPA: UDP-N-acetylmuramoyl-tripeptide--D-alanyl-D-alanine ligase [Chloroflexia bacterium]|nr:UDP-N-acetylmuramoyl-tripeptide--D-alanyl-D-alanine ligase [Chloroflexia bacterium]
MTTFTLHDILQGTGGELDARGRASALAEVEFRGVTIDSRGAQDGALFVALQGERVDGHAYVAGAVANGAHGALVRRDWPTPDELPEGVALVRVDDPLAALQALARWWRERCGAQAIAITGSIGKTSTKEALAAVLSEKYSTLKSAGNLNNEIGLPLTLLRLTPEHEKAVLEMGAGYALGELTFLCGLAAPEIAVVTNVGPVHLERMGTIERIALNKSELVAALPASGTAVLNGDDARVRAMHSVTQARVLFYGLGDDNDLRATDVVSKGLQGVDFTLEVREMTDDQANVVRRRSIHLPLLGKHSVYTALAAAGAAHAAGMSWDEVVQALEGLHAQVRLLPVAGLNGSTLIDDSYNAAPDSVVAALDLLSEMPGAKIAVLGDMLELGSHTEEGHLRVGRRAAEVADMLVAVGNLGRMIGEEAQRAGMPPGRVFFSMENSRVIDYLRGLLKQGDHVLVKGSRGLYMDKIVEGLKVE